MKRVTYGLISGASMIGEGGHCGKFRRPNIYSLAFLRLLVFESRNSRAVEYQLHEKIVSRLEFIAVALGRPCAPPGRYIGVKGGVKRG